MLDVLFSFLSSFRMYFQSSAEVQLEILALRHQIAVLQRKTPKPKLTSADRRLWVWPSRSWFRWRSALVVVKPDTVINWHRRGFRWYWTWKVRHGKAGRPGVPPAYSTGLNSRNRRQRQPRCPGSFRAMRPGNVESVTCRPHYPGDETNPPSPLP